MWNLAEGVKSDKLYLQMRKIIEDELRAKV